MVMVLCVGVRRDVDRNMGGRTSEVWKGRTTTTGRVQRVYVGREQRRGQSEVAATSKETVRPSGGRATSRFRTRK
jgi:hypothetical protein